MMLRLLVISVLVWNVSVTEKWVYAAETDSPLPTYSWSHSGLFGTIDKSAAQRGLQVYEQVCKACHGLTSLSFRHLVGIGFTDEQIKAFAATYTFSDTLDEQGQITQRSGKSSDFFPNPYRNDVEARLANNGVLPPDLSLIVAARNGGEDYITALLTGYQDPPEEFTLAEGQYYNRYFPGHQLAMPQLLFDDAIEYTDGTRATVLQQAKDVATFLVFASDIHHDWRKQLGVRVLLFLIIFAGLMFATQRKLWSEIK